MTEEVKRGYTDDLTGPPYTGTLHTEAYTSLMRERSTSTGDQMISQVILDTSFTSLPLPQLAFRRLDGFSSFELPLLRENLTRCREWI